MVGRHGARTLFAYLYLLRYNFARPDDREVAFDEYRKHLDSKLFGSLCMTCLCPELHLALLCVIGRIAPRDVLTWLQPLVQLAGRSPNSPAPEVRWLVFGTASNLRYKLEVILFLFRQVTVHIHKCKFLPTP